MKIGVVVGLSIAVIAIILVFAVGFGGDSGSDLESNVGSGSDSANIPVEPDGGIGDGATGEELPESNGETVSEPQTVSVDITSSGFSPKTLEINAGDTVTWTNKDSSRHWPASAVHPSHTVYPGSSISKCGSNEADEIFDSCKGLETGESYSFIFTEKGSWGYHDHLKASLTGKIIVN